MKYFIGDDDRHQMQQKTLSRLLVELRIPAEVRVRFSLVFVTPLSGGGGGGGKPAGMRRSGGWEGRDKAPVLFNVYYGYF